MLASSPFFKLFPPPKFLLMPHAGLDISDDAISCIAYSGSRHNKKLATYGRMDLPPGLIDGGDVKDEKELASRLTEFVKSHGLSYVKVSIPEEKSYLFGTEVPSGEFDAIEQNIEFKLEENVPLSAPDALFYFDLIPASTATGALRANVSVVPRTYIERYVALLKGAGLRPLAFEVAPKSIARATALPGSYDTRLIIHVMNRKTGIYIVSGTVVNFASTVGVGGEDQDPQALSAAVAALAKEIDRVQSYWSSHGTGQIVHEVLLAGRNSPAFEAACEHIKNDHPLSVRVADIWQNAFNVDRYLPPISREESLGYAVAAGLALDPSAGD
ncbi:MAG: pilM [Candidatus Parcubacteria bacterium]|nr:pilM [Candidatus Parcubacteria bacterium]